MMNSSLSPWTSKWNDIFDFTPNKKADTGLPNFYLGESLEKDFMMPLERAKKIMYKM